jgi:Spy/CpxP family protein refolding chaperone
MKLTKFLIPKAAFIAVLAVMFIASQSYSQQSKFTPEQMASKMTERLTKHLSLTGSQQTQVHDIVLNYATSHDKSNFNRTELRTQIESVLTDDQKVKYEAFMQKMKSHKKGRKQKS